MNYYERHIGDYIKDTVSLSMLEDGAYNRLMDQNYQTEKFLPLDVKEIYREARAHTLLERKAVDYVLNKFFTKTEKGYSQKRIEAEIARFQDKQRKAKASADARWNKDKTPTEGNANASTSHDASDMRTHSEGNALQSPVTSNHISSSLRSEDSAAKPLRTPSRPKREEVTLAKYLENCKASGVKPVPDAHAIRAWCCDAKIPTEMLQVAWVVFREKYTGDEKLKGKRYKDWATHFATSVKDRWYGLWFTGEDGVPAWTSTGMQRKQVLEANQQKTQESAHEHA